MPRNGFNAPGAASVGSYSHAVEIDGFVYLSGQTALDPTSAPVGGGRPAADALAGGTIVDQTRQCFANLLAVLTEAGLSFDDVIKCNTFLIDMADFAEYDEVYRGQFTQPFPARTTVQVAGLPLGARIEIEMVAHR